MRFKPWKKSSINSSIQTSIQTSIYSPRSSFQDQRSSIQTSQRSSAQTHLSSLQDQRSWAQTHLYSTHDPRPSPEKPQRPVKESLTCIQVSHSTTPPPNTPSQYPRHPLSPPALTPYDHTGWSKANTLLSKCSTLAQELDTKATKAETHWLRAEQATHPSSRSHIHIPAKILLLREINDILVQTHAFLEKEPRWRRLWKPCSPYVKFPAWGSCYAEYLDVYEGEGVAPMLALELLEWRLLLLLGKIEDT